MPKPSTELTRRFLDPGILSSLAYFNTEHLRIKNILFASNDHVIAIYINNMKIFAIYTN